MLLVSDTYLVLMIIKHYYVISQALKYSPCPVKL